MVEVLKSVLCPTCGGGLSQECTSEDLCPSCLIELALGDSSLAPERAHDRGEAPTLQFTPEGLAPGQIQGDRYRIRSFLGRGGMGEVWRAYDLKLRQDVALKSLRPELTQDALALEALRQEVRVAREVISPNICRVYDLEEIDGRELISMEYVDGTTLRAILKRQGALELDQAREIASQFLAGLEAIHEAGLVHRDIKPENLMVTHAGRVVVMDFGIAKGLQERKGKGVAGTPAYMSPEQAWDRELDARSDLFSAGVVLAEMVEPGGTRSIEDRKRVWEAIHQDSPGVAETAWSRVIAKAVAPERDERFASASALARALEEVTLRATGDEDTRPYPGLSAFREEDARFFFGRELEVEALWKKLRRPQLLALIGPSGAGKSSFLGAGLIPALPEGWDVIATTPGARPFTGLARALAKRLPADQETVDALLRFEKGEVAESLLAQWGQERERSLLIVDQFEELFTQSPRQVQVSFAEFLGRLPLRANVNVLLSMRDDFLAACHEHEALQPILSDLTMLGPPTGASLRRAIVQPALKCGYRFEDESLVEEMLSVVEGERGSLPMVAFAVASLWEHRDREQGLLSREAYEHVGGVGGALAGHAEATLERIGKEGVPIARELFRNLVTAQGTRASRDRDELLSVFDRDVGEDPVRVLDTLIDERLLTSYEVTALDEADTDRHRIEIIHESLLSNWPRLVRWRTQDAAGAQLRDELRQSAQMWEQHGRAKDLLWTGTAFREFQLWRERYPGGLSAMEEDFARAMTTHAARRRRLQRIAVAVVIFILLGVLGIFGTLWRQAEEARKEAVAETRRAESAKLLALGRLELETFPTASVAYALASLELADSEEARRFAVEALWRRPTATLLTAPGAQSDWQSIAFSPNGRWLALGSSSDNVLVWSQDGGAPRLLEGHGADVYAVDFSPDAELLFTWSWRGKRLRTWSTRDWREIRSREFEGPTSVKVADRELLTFTQLSDEKTHLVRSWPLGGGGSRTLGYWQTGDVGSYDVDYSGALLGYTSGESVFVRSLREFETNREYLVGRHDAQVARIAFDRSGERLASVDKGGRVRLWSLSGPSASPIRAFEAGPGAEGLGVRLAFDTTASKLAFGTASTAVRLWDLEGPPSARPISLSGHHAEQFVGLAFHPSGHWLAAAAGTPGALLWPLDRPYARVLEGHSATVTGLVFGPDSTWLASASFDGTVRQWPLRANEGQNDALILFRAKAISGLAIDPQGKRLLVGEVEPKVSLLPLGPGAPRRLTGFTTAINMLALAFSADGRLAAAGPGHDPEGAVIRVWELESGESRVLGPSPDLQNALRLGFLSKGRLVSTGFRGILLWDLEQGTSSVIYDNADGDMVGSALSANRESLLFWTGNPGKSPSELFHYDVGTKESRVIASHGARVGAVALDPSGTVAVTGDVDGIVRVGAVTGEEPHLLLGHQLEIWDLSISPDGRWIASGDKGGTIRLWPMPDLSQPPFHTLPHDELLTKLRSLTNLRIVEDPASPTRYTVEPGPFRGWKEVPEW